MPWVDTPSEADKADAAGHGPRHNGLWDDQPLQLADQKIPSTFGAGHLKLCNKVSGLEICLPGQMLIGKASKSAFRPAGRPKSGPEDDFRPGDTMGPQFVDHRRCRTHATKLANF